MKNYILLIIINLTIVHSVYNQNYFSAVYPDANGQIELSLLNYCGTEIQWQTRDTSSGDWLDIPDGTSNFFLYDAIPDHIDGKEFRAEVIMFPDPEPKFSYPFGIRLISELAEIQVYDFYDGSFIYYSSNDTLLGTYFINESAPFGCPDDNIEVAEGKAVGTGKQNTIDILENCQELNIAARICDESVVNDKEDWYLPSTDELALSLICLGKNGIDYIQRQYGIVTEEVKNSKFFWSSSLKSSTGIQTAYYNLIYGGEIYPESSAKKNAVFEILVSREVDAAEEESHQAQSILVPFQFLSHIEISVLGESPSIASISFIGNDQSGSVYHWDFDGGEVLSGVGAGPYLVRYPNALYKRVSMHYDTPSCNSPIFRADEFHVRFFEDVETDFPEIYNGCVRWGDFNNNSFSDVMVTGSNTTQLFFNDKQGGFIDSEVEFAKLTNSYISLGDYDNDGLLDILACGSTSQSVPQSVLYRNVDGQIFSEVDVELPQITNGFVEWLDYNNDGMLDVLMSGSDMNGEPLTQLLKGNKTGEFVPVETMFPDLTNSFAAIDDYNKDGFVDFVIMGIQGETRLTQIYKNIEGSFELTNNVLTGLELGEATWADFDQDGLVDLVCTGNQDSIIVEVIGNSISVDPRYAMTLEFYKQVEVDSFYLVTTDPKDYGFPAKYANSSIDAGDYNNDGFDDLLLTGVPSVTWVTVGVGGMPALHYTSMPAILENDAEGGFQTNNVNIPSFWTGDPLPKPHPPSKFECASIKFGHVDNDGNLDVLREGRHDELASGVYRNTSHIVNNAPSVPENLIALVTCDSVFLSWSASIDDHTHSECLTYEMYLRSTSGQAYIFSQKNSRKMRTTSMDLDSLPDGTYYWGVKAVDNAKVGSDYSDLHSFEVNCAPVAISNADVDYAIDIFPNPFSEDFTILVEGVDQPIYYSIVSVEGVVVSEGNFRRSINISDEELTAAFYFVNLKIGEKTITKKVLRVK